MKKNLLGVILLACVCLKAFGDEGVKMNVSNEVKEKTGSANIIFADYPDVDVIRVDDTYYMVSTTMHFMPGCVLLRSYNLLDWEIASYVYDELDGTPGQRLWDDRGIYGQGMWAASLRYHKGKFYVSFVANDTHKTYLYTSENIEGPWKKSEIQGFYHDMSILFDEDENGNERVFVVSGNTEIHLTELNADLAGPKKGGINKVIVTDTSERYLGFEGAHFYKINGKYYIFFIHWPKGKYRTEACFVSDKVDGPYTGGDVLSSDLGNWDSGVAQGGIVDTKDGRWYGVLFQDHGALGRIPVLVPVNFENDYPVFGVSKNGKQIAPATVSAPDYRPDYVYKQMWNNDFIKDGKLCETWQWNHIPDRRYVKLENNELKIKTGKVVRNVCQAANTLTQRPLTEKFSACVTVDASAIKDGDFAGVCALEGEHGFIAVTKKDGKFKVVQANRANKVEGFNIGRIDTEPSKIMAEADIKKPVVTFRVDFEFGKGKEFAKFYYAEGKNPKADEFKLLGPGKKLSYTLDQFVGCRFALFNFATVEAGGEAKFFGVKKLD